jgi:hypothetical protein
LVIVAAAVSAMLAMGAQSAIASCGDWLVHDRAPNRPGVTSSQSANRMEFSFVARQQQTTLPVPCGGPNCQRAPLQPVVPASPGITLSFSELAVLVAPAAWMVITQPDSAIADTSARPTKGFPLRIDHPPRG